MANKIVNQSNYQDVQNFDININKIYDDFILAIDKIRSYTNTSAVSEQQAKSFVKDDPNLSDLKKAITFESTLQESRCHAFYRMIGFPVVSQSSKEIYNPGFDIIYSDAENRKIGASNSAKKLEIAAAAVDGFRTFSLERENYISSLKNIFSNRTSIDASALALSSINIRKFVAPFDKSSDAFDNVTKNQQYEIILDMPLGGNQFISLKEFVDVDGNKPNIKTTKSHYIKPFIVDPIIDFTVNDPARLVAVPFAYTKNDLNVKDNVFVNRPLIEKIIRDRFTTENQSGSVGSSIKSSLDYIQKNEAIKDNELVQKIKQNLLYPTEQSQFVKYFNIIVSMIQTLIAAQSEIEQAQFKYYWLPIPAVLGPEGGCTVQPVMISSNIPNNFITALDRDIIEAKLKSILNDVNSQIAPTNGTPDIGGFGFDSFNNTFGPDTSSSLGDSVGKSLKNLTNKRLLTLQKAGESLKTIEIIMGEYSGLGLCDIIAILGALYIMPKADLIGFLDVDAVYRMNKILKTNESSVSIQKSMDSLAENVKNFYNLMDKIYIDIKGY